MVTMIWRATRGAHRLPSSARVRASLLHSHPALGHVGQRPRSRSRRPASTIACASCDHVPRRPSSTIPASCSTFSRRWFPVRAIGLGACDSGSARSSLIAGDCRNALLWPEPCRGPATSAGSGQPWLRRSTSDPGTIASVLAARSAFSRPVTQSLSLRASRPFCWHRAFRCERRPHRSRLSV